MTAQDGETVLGPKGAGSTVVQRREGVVLRPTGPWAPTVHSLLRHPEDVGFAGSPRVVGSGFAPDGRETLSYIEEFVGFPHRRFDLEPDTPPAFPGKARPARVQARRHLIMLHGGGSWRLGRATWPDASGLRRGRLREDAERRLARQGKTPRPDMAQPVALGARPQGELQ